MSTPAKKTLRTKNTASEKKKPTIHIKYADKSGGQPELAGIFQKIRKMMEPYDGKRSLVLHAATGGQANLVSHKPVEINGSERKELWFVSALVQKGYVGFYFTGINTSPELRDEFSPEFLKCLKGKGCFHIKKDDPSLMNEIKKAIRLGYDSWVEKGWL